MLFYCHIEEKKYSHAGLFALIKAMTQKSNEHRTMVLFPTDFRVAFVQEIKEYDGNTTNIPAKKN